MRSHLQALVKSALHAAGLDVVRVNQSPHYTLLGLKHLPIKTVIDVGANQGQFAVQISKVFPDAELYCFEPLAEPFAELQRWAKTQRQQQRVKVFNVALGEKEEERTMFLHTTHSPSSSLLQSTDVCSELYPQTQAQASVTIKLMTLDGVLGGAMLKPDVLIKLDTQGYEKQVIIGGSETFRRAAACIIEVNLFRLYEDQPSFVELVSLLDQYGYRYAGNLEQTYDKQGKVVYVDAVFLKSSREAVPQR